jgi:excisionase family DNA binding protein
MGLFCQQQAEHGKGERQPFMQPGNQPREPSSSTSLVEASQLITVKEAMKLLRVGRTKLYTLMYEGRLSSVKIDNARRIKLASALALIEASTETHGKA